MKRYACLVMALGLCGAVALTGCSTGVTLGASFPVGGHGGVGVVIGPDGTVHTRVGVSVGGGQVSVGGTANLPKKP